MQSILEGQQTILYVQNGATRCIPYYRPRKYPLTLVMHEKLRSNAYNRLPNKSKERTTRSKKDYPEIEPWHDYEASLYDLPKPYNHDATTARQFFTSVHSQKTTGSKMELRGNASSSNLVTFPEDLDISFHCGQLDTSFNFTKTGNTSCSNFEETSEKTGPVIDISTLPEPNEARTMVVPDCDDVSLEHDYEGLMGTDSLYTDTTKVRLTEVVRAGSNKTSNTLKSIIADKQDLPLLFYPRSKKKKVTKPSRNSMYN